MSHSLTCKLSSSFHFPHINKFQIHQTLERPSIFSLTASANSSLVASKMPLEDSKHVKKEQLEDEDDDDKPISVVRAKNKKNPSNSVSPNPIKVKKEEGKSGKVKKEERSHFDSDYEKPISRKVASADDKSQRKKKKVKEEQKTVTVEVKKRERKVYNLPGQKRDTPEERDPLRIFYETLYKQVPNSEMAAIWMMESGLLPENVAKKVYEMKQKIKPNRMGTPTKPARMSTETSKSVTVKKKLESSNANSSNKKKTSESTVVSNKRKKNDSSDEDSEDEFIISKKVVKKTKTG